MLYICQNSGNIEETLVQVTQKGIGTTLHYVELRGEKVNWSKLS